MGKVKNTYSNIEEIKSMAESYGVKDNPFFKNTLANYETVQLSIGLIHKVLTNESDLTVTKQYVKGRENTYLHPAVKELPKQVDIANKTMDTMLKIIAQFGTGKKENELLKYLAGDKN